MDDSTEESDSRTAAFSRKRKQPSTLQFEQNVSDSGEKRQKVHMSDDEFSGRRSSRESGEISTSHPSTRRTSNDSGGVSVGNDAFDRKPAHSYRPGWATGNHDSYGDDDSDVDIITDQEAAGQQKPTRPKRNKLRREAAEAAEKLIQQEIKGQSAMLSNQTMDPIPDQRKVVASDIVYRLQNGIKLRDPDYQLITLWLEMCDRNLTIDAIHHAGLKARILELQAPRQTDERYNLARIILDASRGGNYAAKAKEFLSHRFMSAHNFGPNVPSATNQSLIEAKDAAITELAEVIQTSSNDIDPSHLSMLPTIQGGPSAATLLGKTKEGKKVLSVEEYQAMAGWLELNDPNMSLKDIDNGGLKDRVNALIRPNGVRSGYHVAEALFEVTRGGSFQAKARDFLLQRFQLSAKVASTSSADARMVSNEGTQSAASASTSLRNTKRPDWLHVGLFQIEDITNHSLKSKITNLAKNKRKESVEETLRTMVVRKEPSFAKAQKFLESAYSTHNITGERRNILKGVAGPLSSKQLEKMMANENGFLRPVDLRDITDTVWARNLLPSVNACMQQSAKKSYAGALLDLGKGGSVDSPAMQCLNELVKILYIGSSPQGTSIHCQENPREQQTTFNSASASTIAPLPAGLLNKLNTKGAASLTVDELGHLISRPGFDPLEKQAKKKAKTPQHVRNMWKKCHLPHNHLIAGFLLDNLKKGQAVPNAREDLDKFVTACHGGSGSGDGVEDGLDMDVDDLTGGYAKDDESHSQNPDDQTSGSDHEIIVNNDALTKSTLKRLPLHDLERLLRDTKEFTRPMDSSDVERHAFLMDRARAMQGQRKMPLEKAMLQLADDKVFRYAARKVLVQYISQCRRSVPLIASKTEEKEESADESMVASSLPVNIMKKFTDHGAAALTLEELEHFIPGPPGSDAKGADKQAARDHPPQTFLREPDKPRSQAIAYHFLQALKSGDAPPNRRNYLDIYVDNSEGKLGKGYSSPKGGDMQLDEPFEDSGQEMAVVSRPQNGNESAFKHKNNGPQPSGTDSFAALLSLSETEELLSRPDRFTRPLDSEDLGSERELMEKVREVQGRKRMSLEQALLHLSHNQDFTRTARKVLNRYIDECCYNARPTSSQVNGASTSQMTSSITHANENRLAMGTQKQSFEESKVKATIQPKHKAKSKPIIAAKLGLSDIERMLSDRTNFSRRLNSMDMAKEPNIMRFVDAKQEAERKEDRMAPEEAVMYLAWGKDHLAPAARRIINTYIDKCYIQEISDDTDDEVLPDRSEMSYDYGEIARSAAAVPNGNMDIDYNQGDIRLHEISDFQQALQRRYFQIRDPSALVRCLCCGQEGHMAGSCPARTCEHCGAVDKHIAVACPTHLKCGRCRQRGHLTKNCRNSSSIRPGVDTSCDLCGRIDHIESECAELAFSGLSGSVKQIPREVMIVSCYKCGASGRNGHWGDDCPQWRRYREQKPSPDGIFSREYAEKFVLKEEEEVKRPATNGNGGGSVPAYQLAMLGDMMN